MYQNNVTMKKSVSCFVGGKQVACVARDDVPVVLLPRKNHQQKQYPVSVKVMYDNIICAKGRYAD